MAKACIHQSLTRVNGVKLGNLPRTWADKRQFTQGKRDSALKRHHVTHQNKHQVMGKFVDVPSYLWVDFLMHADPVLISRRVLFTLDKFFKASRPGNGLEIIPIVIQGVMLEKGGKNLSLEGYKNWKLSFPSIFIATFYPINILPIILFYSTIYKIVVSH